MEAISSKESQLLTNNIQLTEFMPPNFNEQKSIVEKMKWTEAMDLNEGYMELEKHFYPFKEVKYYSYLDAFNEARKLNKLVHFIMLWGALDVSIEI